MKKQIIITGGYSGIGLELSKIIIKQKYRLGLIIRNENRKINFLIEHPEFKSEDIDFFFADLSNQEHVIQVTNEIKEKWDKVNILFNNAGVLLGEKKFSTQGNEMHYEVNTLAPYLLTINLHQSLINANGAVVVNTATDGLNMMKSLKMEELINPLKFKKLLGSYMQSKLALVLLMNDLAKEWHQQKIRILSVAPGGNKTKLSEGNGMPFLLKPIVNLFYKNPIVGARLLYEAAFNKDYIDKTGVYLQKNKIEKQKLAISKEQKEELLKGLKLNLN